MPTAFPGSAFLSVWPPSVRATPSASFFVTRRETSTWRTPHGSPRHPGVAAPLRLLSPRARARRRRSLRPRRPRRSRRRPRAQRGPPAQRCRRPQRRRREHTHTHTIRSQFGSSIKVPKLFQASMASGTGGRPIATCGGDYAPFNRCKCWRDRGRGRSSSPQWPLPDTHTASWSQYPGRSGPQRVRSLMARAWSLERSVEDRRWATKFRIGSRGRSSAPHLRQQPAAAAAMSPAEYLRRR